MLLFEVIRSSFIIVNHIKERIINNILARPELILFMRVWQLRPGCVVMGASAPSMFDDLGGLSGPYQALLGLAVRLCSMMFSVLTL